MSQQADLESRRRRDEMSPLYGGVGLRPEISKKVQDFIRPVEVKHNVKKWKRKNFEKFLEFDKEMAKDILVAIEDSGYVDGKKVLEYNYYGDETDDDFEVPKILRKRDFNKVRNYIIDRLILVHLKDEKNKLSYKEISKLLNDEYPNGFGGIYYDE